MPSHSHAGIVRQCHDGAGTGEKRGGAASQGCNGDVLIQEVPPIGDAGFAVRQVGFAAMPVMGADQCYAGAEPCVVMDMHVVWDTKASDQIMYRLLRVVQEMMHLQVFGPGRT